MRPLRVGFVTPNLIPNGVFHWICDLAANTETQRVSWCGGLITGPRAPDPRCASRLGRLMPLHCWQVPSWVAAFDLLDTAKVHSCPEDAYQALEQADVVLAWELDQQLHWFFERDIPVVLVSHGTWWAPTTELTKQRAITAAVSQAAAKPFQQAGLHPTVLHSGISWDRCSSAAGRENVRRYWRAGAGHFVTACLDRHAPEKRPRMLPYVMRSLDYKHLAVMYGADNTGRPAPWLVEESAGIDRVLFHAPIENVGDVYSGADLIFTASAAEAFGQTMIEGLACGRPVLARAGLGVIPELEQLFGDNLVFKFGDTLTAGEIGETIELLRSDPPDMRPAQEFIRDYLSARRGAARWTDFLSGFRKNAVPVSSWGREQKARWRTPNRPFRGLALCRDLADLLALGANPREDVSWTAAVVCDSASLQGCERIQGISVITELTGPEWCQRQADLAPAVKRLAIAADFAYSTVPDETERILLDGTRIPSIRDLADVRNLHTFFLHETTPELRAVFLCTPIGHGGTERWAEQLFARGASSGIKWIGCCSVDGKAWNQPMVRRFQQLGVEVLDCGDDRQVAANAIKRWQPDIVVYTGLERIGQCIPPGYAGPIVAIQHNSGFDYYARAWAYSSDPFTSHSAAVSYLAALAYPMERREDVTVLYPGIENCDFRSQRASVRTSLGFTDQDIVICYAGRADANKRPDLLARAVAKLPTRYKLLHVGNLREWTGPEPYLEYLAKILPGRFKWMEFTDQLDRVLAGVDSLVLCSQHESFGIVLMQALQQGCSVIGPSRSAVGEFNHDPNWANTPWTVFDGDDPDELAERIQTLQARPRDDKLPPIQQYFGADVAATNFHQFLRSTLKNPTGTGRVQLRQLRQLPVPIHGLPTRTAVCDVVLPLGPDILQNQLVLEEFAQQQEASVLLHAVGDPEMIARLQPTTPNFHIKFHPSPAKSWFGAFLACRQALTSDFVLDAAPGVRNSRDRAFRMVNEVRNFGLECLVDGHESTLDVGRSCFRRQTLIDFWLSGVSETNLLGFRDDALARGRHIQFQDLRVAHVRQPFTLIPFLEPVDMCQRPGRVPFGGCAAVLPFRGHTDWAMDALKSLQEQKDAGVSIHLVDDSTGTQEAEDFLLWAKQQPNVRTYRSVRNIGQFMCANAVIARNRAECWLIQDADDISDPLRAWYTYHGLREGAASVFTASVLAFGGSMRMLEATYPYPGSWYFAINPVCGFTQGVFEQLGGYFDFGHTETNKASLDTDFFLRAAARDLPFFVAGRPLLYYRQHVSSCTGSQTTGIGSELRTKLEREITMRQVCETTRYIRGSFRDCVDLIKPF